MPSPPIISRLAESEGHVAVFDHVLDLSPHCESSTVSPSFPPPKRATIEELGAERDILVNENKMMK